MTTPTSGSSIQISSGAVTHNLTNSRTWHIAYALQSELMGDESPNPAMQPTHAYDVRPRKHHRGVNLISDALPFGALWYGNPDAISNAVNYAKFYSRSHDAVIRVYDDAGNM